MWMLGLIHLVQNTILLDCNVLSFSVFTTCSLTLKYKIPYWVKHRRKPFRGFCPLLFNPVASTVGKFLTAIVVYVTEVIKCVKKKKMALDSCLGIVQHLRESAWSTVRPPCPSPSLGRRHRGWWPACPTACETQDPPDIAVAAKTQTSLRIILTLYFLRCFFEICRETKSELVYFWCTIFLFVCGTKRAANQNLMHRFKSDFIQLIEYS